MQTAAQHASKDRDRAQRIQGLTVALNSAIRDAAESGLAVEIGFMSVHTVGQALEAPQLAARVAREVEVR